MDSSRQPPKPAKPKSILKKKSSGKAAAPTSATTAQDSEQARNLSLAVQRATIIQAQKDVESSILNSIESLLELPTTPSAFAASPSAADLHTFQTALEPFRPQDFDDLLEERYAAGQCGYALCGRPPRKSEGDRGKWKIGGASGASGVVERRKFEMWCSDACARRAMYVRVQLDDTPAWLRDEYRPPLVKLMSEEEDKPVEEKNTNRFELPLRPKQPAGGQKAALASERGEDVASNRAKAVLKDDIVEKEVSKPVVAPSQGDEETHELIEGYEVGSKPSREFLEDLIHGI